MPDSSNATGVLNALMAGIAIDEFEKRLKQLDSDEQQTVLCTACYLMPEVRANCEQRADEIAEILRRNSRCYSQRRFRCNRAEVSAAGQKC